MVEVIAEIAGGHVGELEKAITLVDLAKESNAQAVKFQFYKADELCEKNHPDYKLFKSLEFSLSDWEKIFSRARFHDLRVYADVFGAESFAEARDLGVDGFKLHSADLGNINLLNDLGKTNKDIMLGVGGRKRVEIYTTLKFLKQNYPNIRIVLMVGHQTFPTPVEEHNLNEINWFSRAYKDYGVVVGVSDHIDGDEFAAQVWPVVAIGAGASIVEKHLTIDRSLKLEDYESALDVDGFKRMVQMIRAIEPSIEDYPKWTKGREVYRKKGVKVPFAKNSIYKEKEIITKDLEFLRPRNFIDPIGFDQFLDKKVCAELKKGDKLNWGNVECRVGILVNARSASTRLPSKALKKICGKETILLLLERMKTCNVGEIVFCTTTLKNDDELAKLVENHGYTVFRGPSEDVARRLLMAAEKYHFDHIVRVTGDDLLRDIGLIEEAVKSHLDSSADYTDVLDIVYSCGTEIISKRALRCIVDRAVDSKNTEYLSWYLDDETAFVQNRIKAPSKYKKNYRLTLDTQEDLDLFIKIFEELYDGSTPVSLEDALDYLDENPSVAKINQMITPKLDRTELNLEINI